MLRVRRTVADLRVTTPLPHSSHVGSITTSTRVRPSTPLARTTVTLSLYAPDLPHKSCWGCCTTWRTISPRCYSVRWAIRPMPLLSRCHLLVQSPPGVNFEKSLAICSAPRTSIEYPSGSALITSGNVSLDHSRRSVVCKYLVIAFRIHTLRVKKAFQICALDLQRAVVKCIVSLGSTCRLVP